MSFWTENNFEPKRLNRFKVSFGFGDGEESVPYFFVKDFAKPTFDIAVKEHIVAGRTFNFPGNVKWNAVKAVPTSSRCKHRFPQKARGGKAFKARRHSRRGNLVLTLLVPL